MGGVADMLLSRCLREREADGLISRGDYGERPLKIDYSLTGRGMELLPALRELYAWGERRIAEDKPEGGPEA